MTPRARRRIFYLIFFAGGLPALIYQVTWQRVLMLYFGADIYSTTVTVATFMLGLGVGSLAGGWVADRVRRPAVYYAVIEVLMGGFGFASVWLFSRVGHWLAGSSLAAVIVADFLLLLLPTTLMGMTLPLMCRVVVANDGVIGRRLSWLYGVNTLGAALGALLSSYLLIGLFGLDGTTRLAATLNLLLALFVYVLIAVTESDLGVRGEPEGALAVAGASAPSLRYPWVLIFSCLSGFIALGYEIVWFRVLGILLHSTVYVFGTVLFFVLAGIAVGSLLAHRRIDQGRCIERFALCQLGIGAYAFILFTIIGHLSWLPPFRQLIGASFFTTFHPAPELIAGNVDIFSLYSLFDIGGWAFLILGIPAVLMGYGFVNLMKEGSQHVDALGHAVAGVYFANIVGSTLGSLAIGFWIIHAVGSENALRLLIIAGSAIPILLVAVTRHRPALGSQATTAYSPRGWMYAAIVLAVLAATIFPGRTEIIRAIHFSDFDSVDFAGAEDRTGVSVLRRQRDIIAFDQEAAVLGQERLYIDGSSHGGLDESLAEDWPLKVALAAHAAPRRVLSIGLGDGQMGTIAEQWPDVQELVIVELNGTLDRLLSRTSRGKGLLTSKKTRYVVDDGRRWLSANPAEKFDVIMMFPLNAAHAFSGALYSTEFFEILAEHLTDGGIVFLRTVDLYSTPRTLATVFPHVLRMESSAYMAAMTEFRLKEHRLPSPAAQTVSRITADRDVILRHTRDSPINTDLKPNSEYYITYRFVSYLQTRVGGPAPYAADDTSRFWKLIVPAGSQGW